MDYDDADRRLAGARRVSLTPPYSGSPQTSTSALALSDPRREPSYDRFNGGGQPYPFQQSSHSNTASDIDAQGGTAMMTD